MKIESPRDAATIIEKINNGSVKADVKAAKAQTHVQKPKATQKATETTNAARLKLEFSDEQMIEAVKSVEHAASSREISDKLKIADPDQGRGYVRSRMKALVKDGKIKTSKPDGKSRCTFLYSVAQ